jgi:PIN domain nuclease of toxin-antitoxin system
VTLLLDTHAFLWFILNDPQLSAAARAMIVEPANDIEISPASYWEIAIKISLKKYALPGPYQSFMEGQIVANDFHILPILPAHAACVAALPYPTKHKDPFDRLIVAQALVEGIPVVSTDLQLDSYGITRLW